MKNTGQLAIKLTKRHNAIIKMSREDAEKVQYLVANWDKECQWFHRLSREIDNDTLVYTFHDIFIPTQVCSGVEVESDPMMTMKLFQEIRSQYPDKDEFNDVVRSTSVWCHSHVNMPTGPSTTDHEQFKSQINLSISSGKLLPQAMMIINKHNEVYTRIYEPELDIMFEHVPVIIGELPYDFTGIDTAIKDKLTIKPIVVPKKPVTPHGNHGGHHGNHGGHAGHPWAGVPGQGRHPHSGGGRKGHVEKSKKGNGKAKEAFQNQFSNANGNTKKKIAQTSGQPQTGASSISENKNASPRIYHFSRKERIVELVTKINNTNSNHYEVTELMAIIKTNISDDDYDLMNYLTFGDEGDKSAIHALLHHDHTYNQKQTSMLEFMGNIGDGFIEPPELILASMETIRELRMYPTLEKQMTLIDMHFLTESENNELAD